MSRFSLPVRVKGLAALELVDVVDASNRRLAALPLDEVHRQSLYHRSVLIVVFNDQNKLYLQKRSLKKKIYPGRFDVSASGHVQSGESVEEAAKRELREELGLAAEHLALRREIPASAQTGYEFVSLFSAGRIAAVPQPNPEEADGGLFVDRDELAFLAAGYREMLTPALLYCLEEDILFRADPPSLGPSR